MIKDYEEELINCNNAFGKFMNINFNIEVITSGKKSKEQFKQLLEDTIDFCQKQIEYWKSIEDYSSMSNVFISYKKALESAMLLLGETKNLENNIFFNGKILETIKQQVANCGQEIYNSVCKLNGVKSENTINDLTDKIILIEREYNAGKLSNEKAYKHVLKIKNAFKEINKKNGKIKAND